MKRRDRRNILTGAAFMRRLPLPNDDERAERLADLALEIAASERGMPVGGRLAIPFILGAFWRWLLRTIETGAEPTYMPLVRESGGDAVLLTAAIELLQQHKNNARVKGAIRHLRDARDMGTA
ncbi:MAG: hypothetical protein ACRDJS_04715 [Actinomycetota bacterium]